MTTHAKSHAKASTHASKSTKPASSHAASQAAKKAPAKTAPAKAAPAKAAPAKPAPAKPAPAKPAPAKPAPAKPAPAKPAPAKPAPTKPVPAAKPTLAKPEPVKPATAKPEPVKPEPPKPEPAKPTQAQHEPVKHQTAKAESVKARPVQQVQSKPTPVMALGALVPRLEEALNLMQAKKGEEAKKAFESLAKDAETHGHFGLVRTARTYLSTLRSVSSLAPQTTDSVILSAQIHLNRKQGAEALVLLDKALASSPAKAQLHYLKATAHAQLEDADSAAQALKKAIELDSTYLFTYRLEDDFEMVRDTAIFVPLENM